MIWSIVVNAQVEKKQVLLSNDTLLTKTNSTVNQLSKKKKQTVLEIIGKIGTKPLMIIDGVIFKGLSDTINTDRIEKLDVLKNNDAQTIYGDQAREGAVLITMKPPAATGMNLKPVIIVNDTLSNMEKAQELKPNDIAWVNVIKDPRQTASYGAAASGSVIEVYTKEHLKRANFQKLCKLSEAYHQFLLNYPGKTVIVLINGSVSKDAYSFYKLSVNEIKQADFTFSETTPSINIITKP
ncbi:hypothetical protein MUGA111182_01450 [Mucilaginibacter galii]